MAASSAGPLVPGRPARALGHALHRRLVAVRPSIEVLDSAALEVWREVRREDPGRRLFLYYWIGDSLPLMLYVGMAGEVPEPIEVVCDDTLGGQVVATVLSRFGMPHAPLRLARPAARIRDMQRLMKSTTTTAIAVDGRGPYGEVGREFARLIRESGALACPVAARLDRSWLAWPRPRIAVPRRRARLSVVLGRPVAESSEDDAFREEMGRRLAEVARAADERLAGRGASASEAR